MIDKVDMLLVREIYNDRPDYAKEEVYYMLMDFMVEKLNNKYKLIEIIDSLKVVTMSLCKDGIDMAKKKVLSDTLDEMK